MKIIKNIGKFLLGVVIFFYFMFVIFNTVLLLNINRYRVTEMFNHTVITLTNKVSINKYKRGDIVFAEKRRLEELNPGDELFIYKVQKTGAPVIDVGIVGEIHMEDEVVSFEDGSTYDTKFLAGVPVKTIPKWGTPLSIVQSNWGFLFIILVPSFMIFIYELYAIVVEIKYGNPIYDNIQKEEE